MKKKNNYAKTIKALEEKIKTLEKQDMENKEVMINNNSSNDILWIAPRRSAAEWDDTTSLVVKINKNGILAFGQKLAEEIFLTSKRVLIGQGENGQFFIKPSEEGYKLYKHGKTTYCIRAKVFENNHLLGLGMYKVNCYDGFYAIGEKIE